jgi:hypothetical protein
MRATSRTLTCEPSGFERTMISSNSFGSCSSPLATTLYWYSCPWRAGSAPTNPAAACTFCSRTAAMTSAGVSASEASRSGSTHSRIA